MLTLRNTFLTVAAMAGMAMAPQAISAATVELDGDIVVTLSQAVAQAQSTDDGPHTINITTNTIALDPDMISIQEPMTIVGDADADGIACDILVETSNISRGAYVSPGLEDKCYIEIQTPGDVEISDLRIHPNEDGRAKAVRRVDGIRLYKPTGESEISNYTLNNVWVSGSNADLEFVRLDTVDDLYDMEGVLRWSAQSGSASKGVIFVSKGPDTALGTLNATLNNCHAGLGKGAALAIPMEGGTVTVNGGLYGHCGQDGIRVTGTGVTLTGSETNRLRVLRAANIASSNSHGLEFEASAELPVVEFVDVGQLETTAHTMALRGNGSNVGIMRHCRFMGSLEPGKTNPIVFMNSETTITVENSTFVGAAPIQYPFQFVGGFTGTATFTDTIFSSFDDTGYLDSVATSGTANFINCALPTDGETSETLATPPIVIGGDGPETLIVNETGTISESPQYLLTVVDYDWSEAQGDGKLGNAIGNANVLRPSNPSYQTASSTGGALNGGAGTAAAGIDPSIWMLMD